MPVPSKISDLTPVASTNSPQGTEPVRGTIDDYLRAHASFIRQLFDQLLGPTVTLPSAATVNIGFAGAANIAISGSTTITAFDVADEGTTRWLTFSGALTLKHNAAGMVLPGAADIVTSAGDVAVFKSLGAGNWKCMAYQRISGTGPVAASMLTDGYLTKGDWNSFNSRLSPSALNNYLPKSGGALTGPVLFAEGSQSKPSIAFVNDGGDDTGFYHIGDGQIGIVCNNVLVGKFTSSGLEVINIRQTQ